MPKLSEAQTRVMNIMADGRPRRTKDVANILGMGGAAARGVGRILSLLCSSRMLSFTRSSEGVFFAITEAGRAALKEAGHG